MTDRLYTKYRVERTDGRDRPGGDKAGARYFVLDYVHDENARAALALYADLIEDEAPGFAADLWAQLHDTNPTEHHARLAGASGEEG